MTFSPRAPLPASLPPLLPHPSLPLSPSLMTPPQTMHAVSVQTAKKERKRKATEEERRSLRSLESHKLHSGDILCRSAFPKKKKKKRFYLTRWFTHYLRASKIQQRRGRGSGRERGQRGESEEPRRVTREWMRLTGSNTNKKKTHTTYCSRSNNASTKKKKKKHKRWHALTSSSLFFFFFKKNKLKMLTSV